MKYLLPIILLTGCSLIPTKFDSVLYNHLITLSVDVNNANSDCGTSHMKDRILVLNRESKLALKYSQYAGKDENASISLVDKNITEMSNIYSTGTPSVAYCQLKLKIIDADLNLILTGIGGKSE